MPDLAKTEAALEWKKLEAEQKSEKFPSPAKCQPASSAAVWALHPLQYSQLTCLLLKKVTEENGTGCSH